MPGFSSTQNLPDALNLWAGEQHTNSQFFTAEYQRIFGGRLIFDAPVNMLVIPEDYLRAPIALADPDWRRRAEREASVVLKQLSGDTEFMRRLKASLIGKLEFGRASLDEAATDLGLTPRTLQRKLVAEGTRFRAVLDEVRLARAEHYLRDPKLRLADVAFLLGYTEQSAFQYAFKQWTGQTPGQFRAGATTAD
mgnify:CR=1 FL=1